MADTDAVLQEPPSGNTMVVGDGFDGGRKPDVREHRSPKGEKRKATTLKESTPGCKADG
ncbi:MAG: hypothetical protein IJW33_03285 [Lentisphaeria bacterium]|nr:hypothetical protein [Lentisphaeria bacterium]